MTLKKIKKAKFACQELEKALDSHLDLNEPKKRLFDALQPVIDTPLVEELCANGKVIFTVQLQQSQDTI